MALEMPWKKMLKVIYKKQVGYCLIRRSLWDWSGKDWNFSNVQSVSFESALTWALLRMFSKCWNSFICTLWARQGPHSNGETSRTLFFWPALLCHGPQWTYLDPCQLFAGVNLSGSNGYVKPRIRGRILMLLPWLISTTTCSWHATGPDTGPKTPSLLNTFSSED